MGLLIFSVSASLCPAQEKTGPIRLTSGVSASEITIGDVFTYHLTLVHDEGYQVRTPPAGENLGHFEIKDFQITGPQKNEDGLMVQRFEYQLSTFTTGEYVIPPVSVPYTDPEGREASLQTQPITVTVKSVLPEEAEDIKDLKQAAVIKADYRNLYFLIGIVILLLAASLVLIFWLRRKKRRRERPAPEEKLPPHLRALSDLDTLCREGLLEAGAFKAFYVRFAEIFLTYLTGRFRVRTFERTTGEIMEELMARSKGDTIPARVRPILDECDLVKFAKYIPPCSYAENIVEKARDFIRKTTVEDFPKISESCEQPAENDEASPAVHASPEGGAS